MLSFVWPPILSQLSTNARHLKCSTRKSQNQNVFLLFGFLPIITCKIKLLQFDEDFLGLIFENYPTRCYLIFFVYLILTNVTNVPNKLALFSLQMYTAQILDYTI
jgi:hypothetical protein